MIILMLDGNLNLDGYYLIFIEIEQENKTDFCKFKTILFLVRLSYEYCKIIEIYNILTSNDHRCQRSSIIEKQLYNIKV